MKFISALSATIIAYATTALASTSWSNCGTAGSVTNVLYNPPQPVREWNEYITMYGNLNSEMTSGSIDLSIYYQGVQLFTQVSYICKAMSCPANAGSFNATFVIPSTAIPSYSPAGQYTGHCEAKDQNGNIVACVNVEFSL